MRPGDLVDLGATAPALCLTWADDGSCWATKRTTRKPRRDGTVPYQVVGPVEDEDAWGLDDDTGFDSDELTRVAVWLLGYYRDHEPGVFDEPEWAGLEAVMGEDSSDAEVVAALTAVVEWCAEVDPERLKRGGWATVVETTNRFTRVVV